MKIGEPRIVERAAQPYVAVRRRVTMPFDDIVPQVLEALFGAMKAQGIEPDGPVIFKHNFINMPELEMDFGVPVATPATVRDGLVSGTLPAGRYAELTALGHYDGLIEANGALIDWARDSGLAFDVRETHEGDYFTARMEIYLNDPNEEPDPDKWETVISIKLRD
jgi:effector-binding domain-containing protein